MGVTSDITTTIGGVKYATKLFPATEGLVLAPRVIALFGKDILELFMATDEEQTEELLGMPSVTAAMLASMAETASKDREGGGWLVMRELMRYVTADKVRIGEAEVDGSVFEHFDLHFAGRYQHLLEVAMWAARAGFGAL